MHHEFHGCAGMDDEGLAIVDDGIRRMTFVLVDLLDSIRENGKEIELRAVITKWLQEKAARRRGRDDQNETNREESRAETGIPVG